MTHAPPPAAREPGRLQGRWTVRRRSGFIPPLGLGKRIGRRTGCTLLFGIPVAWFRVRGRRMDYLVLPIVDELTPAADGSWYGTGRVLGREFCRFAMHPSGRRGRRPA